MRIVEIQFPDNDDGPSDRLAQVLGWVALVLLASVVAVGASLLLWPAPGGIVAEAAGLLMPYLTGISEIGPAAAALPASGPGSQPAVLTVLTPPSSPEPASAVPPTPSTLPEATAMAGPTATLLAAVSRVPAASSTPLPTLPAAPTPGQRSAPGVSPTTGTTGTLELGLVVLLAEAATPQPDAAARPVVTGTSELAAAALPPLADPTHPGAWATPAVTNTLALTGSTLPAELPVVTIPMPLPAVTAKNAFQVNIPDRYLNIVLLGSDKRPRSRAWRTDSMIVVSVDAENHVVRLLSIPRDLWVYIPRHGHNRINTAELWGELDKKGSGTDRVKQTIYHNLGIPIHYFVRVDFQGFVKIVDSVGGVDIDVDCPLPDIKLGAGIHHMDGKHALLYARSRKSTSDIDRGRRQRKVLMALWEQALTLDIIPKLPHLWVTMADSFETDLPLDRVLDLAYIGVQLKPQHILSEAITHRQVRGWMTPDGAAVLVPRDGDLRAFLEDFYAPVDPEPLNVTEKVRVEVLNGAERREAEQLAAAALRRGGFKVVRADRAERQDYAQTEIQVLGGGVAAGERVARKLKVPASAVRDLTGTKAPNPADIVVILGKNYNPCQR